MIHGRVVQRWCGYIHDYDKRPLTSHIFDFHYFVAVSGDSPITSLIVRVCAIRLQVVFHLYCTEF